MKKTKQILTLVAIVATLFSVSSCKKINGSKIIQKSKETELKCNGSIEKSESDKKNLEAFKKIDLLEKTEEELNKEELQNLQNLLFEEKPYNRCLNIK